MSAGPSERVQSNLSLVTGSVPSMWLFSVLVYYPFDSPFMSLKKKNAVVSLNCVCPFVTQMHICKLPKE